MIECKVIMQRKLIVVAYTCVHIETSSLWAEFVKYQYPRRFKALIHLMVSFDQNISLIFMRKMDPMSGFYLYICLVITLPPRVQRQYTAVQKMCTLLNNIPCKKNLD